MGTARNTLAMDGHSDGYISHRWAL
jgi:hypothetical protein